MITILSALGGFVTSVVPELLAMFKDSSQHKRDMEKLQRQAELGLQQEVEKTAQATANADASIYTAAQETARAELLAAKDSWVAAYSATVRPTITYGFFFLFVAVELFLMQVAIKSMPPVPLPWQVKDAAAMVWGEEHAALFSYIMGYWFGSRGFRRK